MPDTEPTTIFPADRADLRGRTPARLAHTWLILVAALLSLALTDPLGWFRTPTVGVARAVLVAKASLFAGFAVANWHRAGRLLRWGLRLVLVGLLSNGLPSFVYGSMPYSTRSAELSGMTPEQVASGSAGHLPVSELPVGLRPFADVVPLPGLRTVMSLGDVLLLAGVVVGTVAVLRGRRDRRARRD